MPPPELLNVRDTRLCVETAGDRTDPAILLISGATATMDLWPDDFRDALTEAQRFVIRYDHRDTGGSATDPPGAPTYTGADLVEDTIGVLDALEIPVAHFVGVSMGRGSLRRRRYVIRTDSPR